MNLFADLIEPRIIDEPIIEKGDDSLIAIIVLSTVIIISIVIISIVIAKTISNKNAKKRR